MDRIRTTITMLMTRVRGVYGNLTAFFLLTLLLCSILVLFNLSRSIDCGGSTGCVAKYWADFWLISYADGYTRRALLGSIMNLVFGDQVHYAILNSIAVALTIVILSFIFVRLFRWLNSNNHNSIESIVVFAALFSGPTTMIFFEVLGDPLHASFLLTLLYGISILYVAPIPSLLIAIVLSTVCMMIHEASVFLFLPAIYLLWCIGAHRKASILVTVIMVVGIGIAFVAVLDQQPASNRSLGVVGVNGDLLFAAEFPLAPYLDLLVDEFQRYFGTAEGFVRFCYKIVGVAIWPLMAIIGLSVIGIGQECIRVLAFLLVASAPLYVVAHDWGRFSIYSLMLAIFIATCMSKLDNDSLLSNESLTQLAKLLSCKLNLNPVVWMFFPLAYYAHDQYRIWGLRPENVVTLLITLVLVFMYSRFQNVNRRLS